MKARSPRARGCSERRGLADPQPLVIACKCDGCDGELHCDSIDVVGSQGSLICTVCRCVYTIPATREIRR